MFSEKRSSPAAAAAIQAFLSNGGEITRVPIGRHGECLRKKGIQFKGKDPETVRQETFTAAEMEQQERQRINWAGGRYMLEGRQARRIGG